MKTGSINIPLFKGKTRLVSKEDTNTNKKRIRSLKQKRAELILKNFEKNGKLVYVENQQTVDGLAKDQEIFVVVTNGFQNNQRVLDTHGKREITILFKTKPDINRVMEIFYGE